MMKCVQDHVCFANSGVEPLDSATRELVVLLVYYGETYV
jgi:hypothetical protein